MLDTRDSPPPQCGTANIEQLTQTGFEASVPECLDPRLEAFADRIAVADPEGDVTYRDLNLWANRIAHRVRQDQAAGTGAVALFLEHGAPFIAGALALLRMGRIYVSLDPDHPSRRNADIARHAEVSLCLTDKRNAAAVPAVIPSTCRVVNIDELKSAAPIHDPDVVLSPDTVAAIYYTSGSTGSPKGVVQSHRSFLARAGYFAVACGMRPDDGVLLVRHVSTMASVRVILAALLSGATLCPWDIRRKGTAGLFTWLGTRGVTICLIPVNVMRRALAGIPDGNQCATVRTVVLTSDPVYRSDVDLWKRRFPNSDTLINQVACNEAGTYRRHFIDRSRILSDGAVPVGYPVDGMELLLRDEGGHDVPAGEIGEIVIKSRYLAKGYWKRPDLTAQAFLSLEGTDERLYRTGDLGVMADDGCLRLAGRTDDRVRVLGNRVEISDIEAALLDLDGIDEVAAVVEPHAEGGNPDRLAAYYVSHVGAPTVREIRAKLSERLTQAMIPTRLVRLDSLPRTASAKIDRRALAARTPSVEAPARHEGRPRDEIEYALVELLEDLLDATPVGIDDDIIGLGADSLTSIELVVAIEEKWGVRLNADVIWSRAGTVAELADLVRGSLPGVDEKSPSAAPDPRIGYSIPAKTIDIHDLITPSLLLVLGIADRLSPKQRTRNTLRALAKLATSARRRSTRTKMEAIGRVLGNRSRDLPPRALVTEGMANFFEELLLRLNGWSSDVDSPTAALEGRVHIDAGLNRGRGVILWRAPLYSGALATRVALKEASFRATTLARPQYGFSTTRVGQFGLNRMSREWEGSLRGDRIFVAGDGQQSVEQVRQLLGRNGIVSINARFHSDRPTELPFFDGRITIATGPPRLALSTGAALIPVFVLRDGDRHFRVVAYPPLEVDGATDHAAATHLLMQRFVACLESHLLLDPAAWPDWRVLATENKPPNTPSERN